MKLVLKDFFQGKKSEKSFKEFFLDTLQQQDNSYLLRPEYAGWIEEIQNIKNEEMIIFPNSMVIECGKVSLATLQQGNQIQWLPIERLLEGKKRIKIVVIENVNA